MNMETSSNINLSSIPSNDLFSVLNIIIQSETKPNSNCSATEICFELFQRCFSTYFKNTNICDDFHVEQLSAYLQQLISEHKFSRELFCELLFNELKDVPLKLIAWLDENNIYFFAQYCMNNKTYNIRKQLINLIESNSRHEISYIFMKIIISVYNIGITNSSKLFTIKCRQILDDLLNEILTEFRNEHPRFINIIPIIGELDSTIYEETIQQLTKQILQKILNHNENITLQDALLMQQLWTFKNVSEEFIGIYYELIKSYKLEDLLELINNVSDRNLNWKFALILISVYVKKNPDADKQITEMVNRRLQTIFNDKIIKTPSTEFLTCIILIRQLCNEQGNPQLHYSNWYSNTFGPDTNLRTGSDSTAFNYLLATLTSIVNKEQIHILKTHIERSIRTPSGCQSDMLVFKDVCRVQLSRIIQSEQINIKNCSIPAITLLEEGLNRFECIWALNQPDICKSLLPFIVNDPKYDRLKNMILLNKCVTETDILECKKQNVIKNNCTVELDGDEEMLFE